MKMDKTGLIAAVLVAISRAEACEEIVCGANFVILDDETCECEPIP